MFRKYIKKDFIRRKGYLRRMSVFLDKDIIKVLIGQRRVGKSYLFYQLMEHIIRENSTANILYINMELPEFQNIKTDGDLLSFISGMETDESNYLFVDEVQEIENYPKALRALLAKGVWDIWVTGSNAEFLSSDISGSLSGRSISFRIYPLNYQEFLTFHELESSDESVEKFLKYGGLPYLRKIGLEDEMVFEYLRNIYNTILYKDVIARYNIKKSYFLEDLVFFLADNLGSIVSAKKISDYLKSQRTNIPTNRVIEYLQFLHNSFFIQKVKRYDIQGKRVFNFNEKYFFQDIGLRNSIVNYKFADIHKILENVVMNHLQSFDYQAYVGSINGAEIDFIFEKNNEKIYVQVAYLLASEDTIEREFGNLKKIKDNYPKYVVSMDKFNFSSDEGIIHLNFRKFLEKKF